MRFIDGLPLVIRDAPQKGTRNAVRTVPLDRPQPRRHRLGLLGDRLRRRIDRGSDQGPPVEAAPEPAYKLLPGGWKEWPDGYIEQPYIPPPRTGREAYNELFRTAHVSTHPPRQG